MEEKLKDEYTTILGHSIKEIEIKKSRFIANLKRCNSEEESLAFIEKINKMHREATHNCTAYINGPRQMVQRYNDDGEPQGTAGIPMLEVLKKEGLTDIAVVVTRYFGGKKLGASGLIRAYGGAVSEVLQTSKIVDLKNFYKIKLVFDYTFLGKIDNYISENNFYLKSRDYLEKVENTMYISVNEYKKFKSDLLDMTSANIEIDIEDVILLQVSKGEIIE
ncbi:YigZ family protein [uncultured Helcococcus sp.]|uniref:YigZ family protein n=1 Tax=uncultured Helcococcus sp. TaxID=1072508 RepID=UPI0026151DAE|nr:YigZ family protein [uncultured Helcococcus sp.]